MLELAQGLLEIAKKYGPVATLIVILLLVIAGLLFVIYKQQEKIDKGKEERLEDLVGHNKEMNEVNEKMRDTTNVLYEVVAIMSKNRAGPETIEMHELQNKVTRISSRFQPHKPKKELRAPTKPVVEEPPISDKTPVSPGAEWSDTDPRRSRLKSNEEIVLTAPTPKSEKKS
jgi:Tfp pilus assembly protein PilO